jgi:dihydrofolate reductase
MFGGNILFIFRMRTHILVAIAPNNVIGTDTNELPWYIPEDLKRFKELTTGHTVIMGRKTFDSIIKAIGKPLPNRTNIVLTSNLNKFVDTNYENVIFTSNIEDTIICAEQARSEECFIIGGVSLFEYFLEYVDVLNITHVYTEYDGTVVFPAYQHLIGTMYKPTKTERFDGFDFETYERI